MQGDWRFAVTRADKLIRYEVTAAVQVNAGPPAALLEAAFRSPSLTSHPGSDTHNSILMLAHLVQHHSSFSSRLLIRDLVRESRDPALLR